MASVVEINNKALSLVGAKQIESLDEESTEARACRLHWPQLRDQVLRGHPWNCAMERVSFVRNAETPAYEYAYYYQLPANCLFVYEVYPEQLFEVEGRKIMANSETLSGKIVTKQTDTSKYDPQLSAAFSYLLAAELAYLLTSSTSLVGELKAIGKDLLSDAKASDSLEGRQPNRRNTKWVSAKYGGR